MDCDYVSRGTGTPVSFGFSPKEVKEIIYGFIKTKKVVCLEFTEVNPLLDNKGNRMAETAFNILNDITIKNNSFKKELKETKHKKFEIKNNEL